MRVEKGANDIMIIRVKCILAKRRMWAGFRDWLK